MEAMADGAKPLVRPPQTERVWDAVVGESQEIGCLASEKGARETVGSSDGGRASTGICLPEEVGKHPHDGVGNGDCIGVRAGFAVLGDFAEMKYARFVSVEEERFGDAEQCGDVAPYLDEATARVPI